MKFVGDSVIVYLGSQSPLLPTAGTMVDFSRSRKWCNSHAAALRTLDAGGNSIAETFGDTSPFDAQVAGFGLSIGGRAISRASRGSPDAQSTAPRQGRALIVLDDSLGSAGRSSTATRFGIGEVTGPNVNLDGGFPERRRHSGRFGPLFTGSLASLAEEEIAAEPVAPCRRASAATVSSAGRAPSGVDGPSSRSRRQTSNPGPNEPRCCCSAAVSCISRDAA